jgi:hypothetical protein
MDTFVLGLVHLQTDLKYRPVYYFYCHECFRWYTVFTEREWPFMCPEHKVKSRKHLSLKRVCSRWKDLSTQPIMSQHTLRSWLLDVFNEDRVKDIDAFILKNPEAEKQPPVEIARRYLETTKKRVLGPPRATNWQYRLVYELGDVMARDELERMDLDSHGSAVCSHCRRLWNRHLVSDDLVCFECSEDPRFMGIRKRLSCAAPVDSSSK